MTYPKANVKLRVRKNLKTKCIIEARARRDELLKNRDVTWRGYSRRLMEIL